MTEGESSKRKMAWMTIGLMVVAFIGILALGFLSDGDPRRGTAGAEPSNVSVGKPATIAPAGPGS